MDRTPSSLGSTSPAQVRPLVDGRPVDAEAEELFDAVLEQLQRQTTRIPRATYRVQFNHLFRFDDARVLVDYLERLGISDVYASPFFRARPESLHGYDLVDHNALNPAIGARGSFDGFSDELFRRDMGLVLDFVPNHMGIGTSENQWWMDVLENGPSSLYASFFDIDWHPLKSELANKVLLPVLGGHYGSVLEDGQLQLAFDAGAFHLRVYDRTLPVNPRTYPTILEPVLGPLVEQLGDEHDAVLELLSILTGLRHLPPRTETQRHRGIERRRETQVLKRRLATLVGDCPEASAALAARLLQLNGTKGDPRSFDALNALLEEQVYRLSYWRVAAEEINYRRFFDVNDLAAIRMENPAVFAEAHRLLFSLLSEGRVTGLRIDHPDGLWDPVGYFRQLQRGYVVAHCQALLKRIHGEGNGSTPPDVARAMSLRWERLRARLMELYDLALAQDPVGILHRPLYVVAEKILSRGESLPEDWAAYGTSGYDFANLVAGAFVDPTSERAMTQAYEDFTGERSRFDRLVYEAKKLILRTSLVSELNVLASALNRLSERDRHSRDFTLGALTGALREVIASFPVYRTYNTADTTTPSEHDRSAITRAIRLARRRNPTTDESVYAFLRGILLLEMPGANHVQANPQWREFVMRFQQLTGPVMAKGVEDTAFYVYNRLASLNEVGGEPERYGVSVAEFHRANSERQRQWPASMLATSTHDTKRSEDVRARITVLSELPAEWENALRSASDGASRLRVDIEGKPCPDPNEEWLLYQSILGTLPFPGTRSAEWPAYVDRIADYMRKATKEAKVNTSWMNAAPEYDAALEGFIRGALVEDGPVMQALAPLSRLVARHGMWASLSGVTLRLTSPGVPDTYQGTELWDFSLVDPDNRRPVDYAARVAALDALTRDLSDRVSLCRKLVENAEDGRIKLYVLHTALQARRATPDVFGARSSYTPLSAMGHAADNVIAFARRSGDQETVVVVPRLTATLAGGADREPMGPLWADTMVAVAEGRFRNLFTGVLLPTEDAGGHSALLLQRVLADFPVAILERTSPKEG